MVGPAVPPSDSVPGFVLQPVPLPFAFPSLRTSAKSQACRSYRFSSISHPIAQQKSRKGCSLARSLRNRRSRPFLTETAQERHQMHLQQIRIATQIRKQIEITSHRLTHTGKCDLLFRITYLYEPGRTNFQGKIWHSADTPTQQNNQIKTMI